MVINRCVCVFAIIYVRMQLLYMSDGMEGFHWKRTLAIDLNWALNLILTPTLHALFFCYSINYICHMQIIYSSLCVWRRVSVFRLFYLTKKIQRNFGKCRRANTFFVFSIDIFTVTYHDCAVDETCFFCFRM